MHKLHLSVFSDLTEAALERDIQTQIRFQCLYLGLDLEENSPTASSIHIYLQHTNCTVHSILRVQYIQLI